MTKIDWSILINWIVSGMLGVMFGVIGGWFTYRYQLRQGEIAWQREKEYQEKLRIREDLMRGLDNPTETIKKMERLNSHLQVNVYKVGKEHGIDDKLEAFSAPSEQKISLKKALLLSEQINELLIQIGSLLKYEEKLDFISSIRKQIITQKEHYGFESLNNSQKTFLEISTLLTYFEERGGGFYECLSDFESHKTNLANTRLALEDIGSSHIESLLDKAISMRAQGENKFNQLNTEFRNSINELLKLLEGYYYQHRKGFE